MNKNQEHKLPELNIPVNAKCRLNDGRIEYITIKRVQTKDTNRGWQWSAVEINTYFTPEVLEWEYLKPKTKYWQQLCLFNNQLNKALQNN